MLPLYLSCNSLRAQLAQVRTGIVRIRRADGLRGLFALFTLFLGQAPAGATSTQGAPALPPASAELERLLDRCAVSLKLPVRYEPEQLAGVGAPSLVEAC